MAGVVAVGIVEQILAPERGDNRQAARLGKRRHLGAGFGRPAAPSHDEQRPLRLRELRLKRRQIDVPRGAISRLEGLGVGDLRVLRQHVFRQCQHHGTWPPRGGRLERAEHVFWNPAGILDLRRPLGERPEHLPVVDFLKRFAVEERAIDLADEEHHRRRVLHRRVHADARMRGARAAGHEADARPACQPAVGLRHVRRGAFVLADDDVELGGVVERVQDIEITLAGNAERPVGAVDSETVDENASSTSRGKLVLHCEVAITRMRPPAPAHER